MDSNISLPSKRKRTSARRWLPPILLPVFIVVAFAWRAFDVERSRDAYGPVGRSVAPAPAHYEELEFNFGRGYIGAGWQLYFNEPDAGAKREDYRDGIEMALVAAIDETRETLDIAAFELNSEPITAAILAAQQRGVAVRIVTDDEHGLEDESDPQLRNLRAAGIALVDDGRSGLMHNKFMILDGRSLWTGSWNYTVNGSYRNNNNALVLEDEGVAAVFQREFDEMFERGEFGIRSSDEGSARIAFGEGEISIVFGAEGDEIAALRAEIVNAEESIRFMSFVFSLEELAVAMLTQADNRDLSVQGIFEERNSTASWSQMPALHCAGAQVRQDGNRYVLHHKVILIDDDTVITGSFNFSASAARRNDENIVIVHDRTIAALYLEEWERLWDSAEDLAPDEVSCD